MDLIIKVIKAKGHCTVYKKGGTFKLTNGYQLESEKPLCMHSLASLMPHYNALRISSPKDWRLGTEEKAFVQYLDPMDHTGVGTAVFEITKSE